MKIHFTKPQSDFLRLEVPFPAFVGGFGSGKSATLACAGVRDILTYKGADIAVYSPTHDLNAMNLFPRFEEMFSAAGVRYKPNYGKGFIDIKGYGKVIFRSMDNPARIVGYEVFRSYVDELDTMPMKKAKEAWNKIIGRNRQKAKDKRTGVKGMNRASVFTTPEGFRFVYDRWKRNPTDKYRMIQASTYSNPHLDEDYVQNLIDTYPENLVRAYLHGEFVNLTAGTVYSSYDRTTCSSNETIISDKEKKRFEDLFIGCDFNVTKMAATIYVRRGKEWHAVGELSNMFDTREMVSILKDRYQRLGHKVYIYPDASGKARKTNNASESDIALLEQAGFVVRAHQTNPAVKDRVMAMNAGLEKRLVKVNSQTCPRVAECLEQQVYNDAGEPDKEAGVDHQNDATTYPIAYEMPIVRPVADIKFKFAT